MGMTVTFPAGTILDPLRLNFLSLTPLLAGGFSWDIKEDAEAVSARLIRLLPGDPWKGGS